MLISGKPLGFLRVDQTFSNDQKGKQKQVIIYAYTYLFNYHTDIKKGKGTVRSMIICDQSNITKNIRRKLI